MREARRRRFSGCTCCASVVTLGRREFVAGGLAALGLGAFAATGVVRNAADFYALVPRRLAGRPPV